jgi:biopolymer transport protein ExbD
MGAKVGTGGGPMADINVTPLIDVVLVLLVVFMVITPIVYFPLFARTSFCAQSMRSTLELSSSSVIFSIRKLK